MSGSKLMTPLFYNGNFNREGRKIQAVFVREITDGETIYHLWHKAGKPDNEYSHGENDNYMLYVETNGYLLPLGMTDLVLINKSGFEPMALELYGGLEDRNRCLEDNRKSGKDISALFKTENDTCKKLGHNPSFQTKYIKAQLNKHVQIYMKSKETCGQTFPDFIGALVLDDLAHCDELSSIFRANYNKKRAKQRNQSAKEDKIFCETKNEEANQVISDAIQIVKDGGILKNTTIEIYESRYVHKSYSLISYLLQQYQIEVPLRTQGVINSKLLSCRMIGGRCVSLGFDQQGKANPSKALYDCLDALAAAIIGYQVPNAEQIDTDYCTTRNKIAEQTISAAIQIILNGGDLKNTTIRFYRTKYDFKTYSLVNHLMRLYHIDVPFRTQGWVNSRLIGCKMEKGKCTQINFYRKKKSKKISSKIFDCMNALAFAVAENSEMKENIMSQF